MPETGRVSVEFPVIASLFNLVNPDSGVRSVISEGQGRYNSSNSVSSARGERSEIMLFPSRRSDFKFVISRRFNKSASVRFPFVKSRSVEAALYFFPPIVTIGADASTERLAPVSTPFWLIAPVVLPPEPPIKYPIPIAKTTAAAPAAANGTIFFFFAAGSGAV